MKALIGLTVIVAIALVLLLSDFNLEKAEPYVRELLNLGHFPLMATVSVLIYWTLEERKLGKRKDNYYTSFLLSVLFVFAIEIIQPFVGRHAEFVDIVHGILGALWGIGLLLIVRMPRRERLLFGATSVALLYYFYLPVQADLETRIFRVERFPLLGNFEEEREKELWKSYRGDELGEVTFVDKPTFGGSGSLKVETVPYDEYSGVHFTGVKQDWSPYQTLQLRVYNPSNESMYVSIRVDDRGNTESFEDRFNTTLEVIPGWNTLSISTEEIRAAEGKRSLDLTSIWRLYIYKKKSQQGSVFFVDEVMLLK